MNFVWNYTVHKVKFKKNKKNKNEKQQHRLCKKRILSKKESTLNETYIYTQQKKLLFSRLLHVVDLFQNFKVAFRIT